MNQLRALHVPGSPLILPNAWDADSARLVEAAGFPVVATSSAAVAAVLGYEDGHAAPVDEMFAAARRIARAVSIPVTVDAEGGYGLSGAELAERLKDAGATGLNFEDTDHAGSGLVEIGTQAERIAALRAASADLVINARIDVFLGAEDESAVLDAAIERAKAYLEAGADCVYPILAKSPEVLGAFVKAVSPAAVNATYRPGAPDFTELAKLGIARISLGGGVWHAAQGFVQNLLADLADGKLPY